MHACMHEAARAQMCRCLHVCLIGQALVRVRGRTSGAKTPRIGVCEEPPIPSTTERGAAIMTGGGGLRAE